MTPTEARLPFASQGVWCVGTALALMMLVVMSIMGASLMQVVSNDHKSNGLKDNSQQVFYAAIPGDALLTPRDRETEIQESEKGGKQPKGVKRI